MAKKYMSQSKWVVFNNKGKRLKTVTLKHKDVAVYRELDPFVKEVTEQGLFAHCHKALNQEYLTGKPFKERLKILGWQFNSNGVIVN